MFIVALPIASHEAPEQGPSRTNPRWSVCAFVSVGEGLRSAWVADMRRGDFESAWRISDSVLAQRARYRCDHLPQDEQWLWDGTTLQGKRVVVRCFHGLGDTIQFIRYVRLLAVLARSVTLVAQPELVPLLRTMNGGFDPLFRSRGVAAGGALKSR